MKTNHQHSPGKRRWVAACVAALLTTAIGVYLRLDPTGIGAVLTRASYDLPFNSRPNMPATNLAIVYMDEVSAHELSQPMAAPWDRSLHAKLIDQLTAEGAKAIVFDILFTEGSDNPAADELLAAAIKKSGRVFLAGNFQEGAKIAGAEGAWNELPYEPFRNGAAGWGNCNFPNDSDFGIRRFFSTKHEISGQATVMWLPAAVAKFAGAPDDVLRLAGNEDRWLNYYGPPGAFPGISFYQALYSDGAAPGFFRDKIVFVGARWSAESLGQGKDEFLTPYAYSGKDWAPGVDIHATATLNLIQSNWLLRVPAFIELTLIVTFGVVVGLGLIRIYPFLSVLVTLLVTLLVTVIAFWMEWYSHLWFAWLILLCQLWLAWLCSVAYNSLRLYVEKRLLEQSLAARLSPAMVKRMLKDPNLRKRGGVKQEVSMMFTDIENFSKISEAMHPHDLVELLNRYFETALQCVHETDGTVMDLVGDAIFAIWNAPMDQHNHRERAFESALKLQAQLAEFNATNKGFQLRTRVGLHTGVVCVANIGSDKRFDYAAVGENTNLASRLEGLNKHLGTRVLATREIQHVIEKQMVSRLVGLFRMKGFGKATEVYELVGAQDIAEATRPWRDRFAEALVLFQRQQFDAAESAFQQVTQMRSGGDGVSDFYLHHIAELRQHPPPPDWIGEVVMKDK